MAYESFEDRRHRILRGLVNEELLEVTSAEERESNKFNASSLLPPSSPAALADNSLRPDRSLKGSVDADLVPTIAAINSHRSFVSTSCCSGRVTLFLEGASLPRHASLDPFSKEGNADNGNEGGKGRREEGESLRAGSFPNRKKGGYLVFVSHSRVDIARQLPDIERQLSTLSKHYVIMKQAAVESHHLNDYDDQNRDRDVDVCTSPTPSPLSSEASASPFSDSAAPTQFLSQGRQLLDTVMSPSRFVMLKFEPIVVHVECDGLPAAAALLSTATQCGLKQSGVNCLQLNKRIVVAVRGSTRLEVPVARIPLQCSPESTSCSMDGSGKCGRSPVDRCEWLISREYFSFLLELCNEKMTENLGQIQRFHNAVVRLVSSLQFSSAPREDWYSVACSSQQAPREKGKHRDEQPKGYFYCETSSTCTSNSITDSNSPGMEQPIASLSCSSRCLGVMSITDVKCVKNWLETADLFDKQRKIFVLPEVLYYCDLFRTAKSQVADAVGSSDSDHINTNGNSDIDKTLSPESNHDFVTSDNKVTGSSQSQCAVVLPVLRSITLHEVPHKILEFMCICTTSDRFTDVTFESALCPIKKQIRTAETTSRKLQEIFQELMDSFGGIETEKSTLSFPRKFERIGDIILFPHGSMPFLKMDGNETSKERQLWESMANLLNARCIGVQAPIYGPRRQSQVRLLYGVITHKENGIIYKFDVTKCMFASGNGTERARMAKLVSSQRGPAEIIVDMFCGIGYFTLPILVRASSLRVAKLYACDWNPDALEALKSSASLNPIEVVNKRLQILQGDSRLLATCEGADCGGLLGTADRILLGLIPSSEDAWPAAVRLINTVTGGILHVHGVDTRTFVAAEQAILRRHSTCPSECVFVANCDATSATHHFEVITADHFLTGDKVKETIFCPENKTSSHCVENKKCVGKNLAFAQYVLNSFTEMLRSHRDVADWWVEIIHVECVKSYAPRRYHFVVDLKCTPVFK